MVASSDFNFSSAQTEEVIRLMDSTNGKYISGASHRIIKNRRWLIIAQLEEPAVSLILMNKSDSQVIYPEGKIHIKEIPSEDQAYFSTDSGTGHFDAGKIKFPLILRKWKAGDYFYPLGMKKKKKLARFFIDQKLSKTAKEKVWVLQMDSQIIWVVGHRIDTRFCISHSTDTILLIRN